MAYNIKHAYSGPFYQSRIRTGSGLGCVRKWKLTVDGNTVEGQNGPKKEENSLFELLFSSCFE
jgi:hypothetical protein